MSQISIIFKNKDKKVKAFHKKEEYLTDIFENYAEQTNLNIKNIFFTHDKNILNSRLEQLNPKNNQEIQFEVHFYDTKIISNKNPIICPKCSECCIFKIDNYRITLYDCLNNHEFSKISIDEFIKSQKIKISNDSFYTCKIHNNENFNFYCDNCKKNLCKHCKEIHYKKHKIIPLENFEDIISLKEKLHYFKNELNKLEQKIKVINNTFNTIINNFENIYSIYNDMINNYHINQLNYQILKNLEIDQNIIDDMKKINQIIDMKTQFNYLMEIFDKMNKGNPTKNNNDKITGSDFGITEELNVDRNNRESIIPEKKSENKKKMKLKVTYLLEKTEKLKLFDEDFLKKINNNEVSLSYGDICFDVTQHVNIDLLYQKLGMNKNANKIELEINDVECLTDLSYMFYNCSSLYSISGFREFGTNNITNMNSMFYGCSNLVSLPDIGDLDVSNVIDMSCLFYGCKSLTTLNGINKWDVSKVKNMSYLFGDCGKLEVIPNIAKWKISNLTNMNFMFSGCKVLISLSGVEKWDIRNIKRKDYLFENCRNLKEIPANF